MAGCPTWNASSFAEALLPGHCRRGRRGEGRDERIRTIETVYRDLEQTSSVH